MALIIGLLKSVGLTLLIIIMGLFILWGSLSEIPLFKKKCPNCGKKDRNWKLIYIGHDNFCWHHNCKSGALKNKK